MKKDIIRPIFIILGSFIIIPIIIYMAITTTSPIGIIMKDDVGYWLGFYGSTIGGAITLIGVWWTINKQDKLRTSDLEELEKRRKEDRRISISPFISYEVDKEIKIKKEIPGVLILEPNVESNLNQNSQITNIDLKTQLILHNIGIGVAVNLHIIEIYYDDRKMVLGYNTNVYLNLNDKASILLPFKFPEQMSKLQKMEMKIKLGYCNILQDFYEQTVIIGFIITPLILAKRDINLNKIKYNCNDIEIIKVEKPVLSDPALYKGIKTLFVIPD